MIALISLSHRWSPYTVLQCYENVGGDETCYVVYPPYVYQYKYHLYHEEYVAAILLYKNLAQTYTLNWNGSVQSLPYFWRRKTNEGNRGQECHDITVMLIIVIICVE